MIGKKLGFFSSYTLYSQRSAQGNFVFGQIYTTSFHVISISIILLFSCLLTMWDSVWQYLWLSIVMDKSWHDVSRKLVLPHMPPPTWGIQSIVGTEMLNLVNKNFVLYLFYLLSWIHLDEILMRIPTVCLPVVNKMIYYHKQFGL